MALPNLPLRIIAALCQAQPRQAGHLLSPKFHLPPAGFANVSMTVPLFPSVHLGQDIDYHTSSSAKAAGAHLLEARQVLRSPPFLELGQHWKTYSVTWKLLPPLTSAYLGLPSGLLEYSAAAL
jgi:hypothetical protein